MTKASARKEDRRALVLFFVLTITFCAVPYVPMLTGGGFDALGGYAVPLLMWSPGLAGIVTSLVMYRSLAPLGLAGNQQALYWIFCQGRKPLPWLSLGTRPERCLTATTLFPSPICRTRQRR